jgi:hypothetical protein
MATKTSHKKAPKKGRVVSNYPRICARYSISIFLSFCAFSWPSCISAQPFNFDDIEFWVGTGANRAALVIDWLENSSEPPALVWGYRWDGAANGRDMLHAVVAADPRLFAKFGNHAEYGAAVFGYGYDAGNDGAFEIDDGTVFDAAGLAFVPSPADGTMPVDTGDYYTEGWVRGFWRYLAAVGNPFDGGTWEDRGAGIDARSLSDGDWDSFTFETSAVPIPPFDGQPANPVAALPPLGELPGDFNHDGQVTAADYAVWRSAFGASSQLDADGNADGIVDAADYVVWRNQFTANQSSLGALGTLSVPEPATLAVLEIALILIHLAIRKEKLS